MKILTQRKFIYEYIYRINTNVVLSEKNEYEEAQKILELVLAVKESGYKPEFTVFWYKEIDSSNTPNISITFDDIKNVDTVEKIIDIMRFYKSQSG